MRGALGALIMVSAHVQRWLLVLGLIYVAVTLFAPAGLVGLLRARRA